MRHDSFPSLRDPVHRLSPGWNGTRHESIGSESQIGRPLDQHGLKSVCNVPVRANQCRRVPCAWALGILALIPVLCLVLAPVRAGDESLTLTLDEAKDLARLQNPDLAVLRAEQDRASGTEIRARRAFLPTLSARVDYLRADSSILDAVPVPDLTLPPLIAYRDLGPFDTYASAVQLTQPLVNLDAWHGHAQARHQEAALELVVSRATRELDTQVTRAYFAVQTVADQRAAIAAALAAADSAVKLAEAAYDEGLAASVDVYRARAEAAARRAQLAGVEGELTAAKARLRQVLGIAGDPALVLVDTVPEPEQPGTFAPGTRDDIRALRRGLDAAESGVRRAGARALPRLNLVARQQWLDDNRVFAGDFDGWLVAVTLSWTPFAGMDQIGERSEARAARMEAVEKLRALEGQAARERDTTRARWQAAFRAWKERTAAVKEAQTAVQLAEGRYREGVGNMTELLAAQAALAGARVERSNARYRAIVAAETYRLAVGRPDAEPWP
jgi:outer membrane protein TolC